MRARCLMAKFWLLLLPALLTLPSSTHALEACSTTGMYAADCRWQQRPTTAGAVVLEGDVLKVRPHLVIDSIGAAPPTKVTPGFYLTIKRLILENVGVGPPTAQDGMPALLPAGMFGTAPGKLRLIDVRLVVSQQDFAAYLTFFSQQLDATILTAEEGSITMYTDGKSFLHIPAWSNSNTELLSTTLASGPCQALAQARSRQDAQGWQPVPGCNLLNANNTTLVPMLLQNASMPSSEPLVIRITSNVTLGHNIKRSIPIRRPVILLGMASLLTSVDLEMVVNQLNVTPPTGTLVWQGLVLENLAPGDTLSTSIAPPYSTTTSTNMWPIYCNRSAALCVRMNNVTMTIPAAREVNYHIFMYTMYNSPAPSLRQLAAFMGTDLGFRQLEFSAGPGNDTMTIKRLLSRSWQFKNVVTTTRTFVAPQLQPPPRPFVLTKTGPAPLVQAVEDCSSFNAAMNYNSTRVFVWRLLRNVSIGEGGQRTCTFSSAVVQAPTHLFGQKLADPTPQLAGQHSTADSQTGLPTADTSAPTAAGDPPGNGLYALSFGYVPSVFEIPEDAQDKHMQLQNVTLAGLPQLRGPDGGILGAPGRLLRQLGPAATPPGMWTCLLWPWRRVSAGSPLFVADSQLVLPEPEWSLLAHAARGDDSFAMQLQGPVGLTFTGVSLLEGQQVIRVGFLQGPGISGSNLWLLPDPTPVSAIPGYHWPASLAAAAMQSSNRSTAAWQHQEQRGGGLSPAGQAALGVGLGVAGVLAAAAVALLLVYQRHRRGKMQGGLLPKAACSADSSSEQGGASVDGSCRRLSGECKPDPSGPASACQDVGAAADVSKSDRTRAAANRSSCCSSAAAGAQVARKIGAGASERAGSQSSSTTATCSSSAVASGCRTPGSNTCSKEAAGRSGRSPSGSSQVEISIAQGLERWSAAVSATTMQLMQRRLQSNSLSAMFPGGAGSSSGSSRTSRVPSIPSLGVPGPAHSKVAAALGAAAAAAGGGAGDAAAAAVGQVTPFSGNGGDTALQQVIGAGSFATVYLGTWRGKQVAVKVMHLPADAMAEQQHDDDVDETEEEPAGGSADGSSARAAQQLRRWRRRWQRQQNSPPQMAIMEAAVSSAMCHPNVVQVYTYMLMPLMARSVQQQQQPHVSQQVSAGQAPQGAAEAAPQGLLDTSHQTDDQRLVSGWVLHLVMELCEQGTLREALDRKHLPRMGSSTFLQPAVVFSLAHDIASALLHVHSEGIVHGDLKAGNVLLTAGSISGTAKDEVWANAGSMPLAAKVSDFGLAMSLGPSDTHATMLARGTPTHQAPENFMAGHVSKASGVYSFGVLLFEIVTGRRAYAGVPIPLLPHEVAVRGLRPEWPDGLPPECAPIQRLAEACWAQEPQSRPSFSEIIRVLEGCCLPSPAAAPAPTLGASGCQQQPAAVQPTAAQAPPPQQQQQQQQRQRVCIQLPTQQQQEKEQQQAAKQHAGLSTGGVARGRGWDGRSPAPAKTSAMDWSEVSYGNDSEADMSVQE